MRKYLAILLGTVLCLLAGIVAFNALIDPLWFFSHQNRWNENQVGFDERQQKTNRVLFGGFDYDGVLLGSSRSTYIDQRHFTGQRIFNFAVSGMRPAEYPGYLRFVREVRGRPVSTVAIGIDFFASSSHYASGASNPEHYFDMARRPFYRAEMLIAADTFKKSKESILSAHKDCDCYSRENIKHLRRVSPTEHQDLLRKDLAHFHTLYKDYAYDDNLPSLWKQLRIQNPETRFIIFTTPISAPLFRELVAAGRLSDVRRWLGDAIEVFGEVTDFMGVNSVTIDDQRYQDGSHFYPETGRLIVERLQNEKGVPADFGVRVTASNLNSHLAALSRQSKAVAP